MGCQHPPATRSVEIPMGFEANAPVEVWVTTGDQAKLLARDKNLPLFYNTTLSSRLTVVAVDPGKTYQQIIGYGAAMTDASAFLIQNKMSAADREALLQDLFGRENGIGMSFIRVPMGASDFSQRHYSYDDMPAGQNDSALAHFTIDVDRVEKLPLLRRAMAINPQLEVMASPWSPPAWMKTTDNLVKGTLLPRYYDSFANYFVKFIQAYGAAGVPVQAITLQNEPNFEPDNYPGMRLDPAARARVIGRHLGPAFARAGIKTLIWDWDHNWDLPQQPLDVLADSIARGYVQGVAWHC